MNVNSAEALIFNFICASNIMYVSLVNLLSRVILNVG